MPLTCSIQIIKHFIIHQISQSNQYIYVFYFVIIFFYSLQILASFWLFHLYILILKFSLHLGYYVKAGSRYMRVEGILQNMAL